MPQDVFTKEDFRTMYIVSKTEEGKYEALETNLMSCDYSGIGMRVCTAFEKESPIVLIVQDIIELTDYNIDLADVEIINEPHGDILEING